MGKGKMLPVLLKITTHPNDIVNVYQKDRPFDISVFKYYRIIIPD